jgi:hypothetical protein
MIDLAQIPAGARLHVDAQVDAAAAEVEQARSEIAAERQRRDEELTAARAAVEAIKPSASASPLANRIGIPAWVLDLITAALGSMAANGLAYGLIAFAAHHRHDNSIEITDIVVEPAPVVRPTEHAAQFAIEELQPAKGKRLDLMKVHAAYRDWCARKGIQPLSANQIGAALAQLFDDAGDHRCAASVVTIGTIVSLHACACETQWSAESS